MKTINVRDLQKKIRHCMDVAQKEHVVVTRHGKPLALVRGVEGYDWDDLYWATNESFWRMIEQRRKEEQKPVPFEEVCRRLGIRPRRPRKPRSKRRRQG